MEENKKKNTGRSALIVSACLTAVIVILLAVFVVAPSIRESRAEAERLSKYNSAIEMRNRGEYAQAAVMFSNLGNYKDAQYLTLECGYIIDYLYAHDLMLEGNYTDALIIFERLGTFMDCREKAAYARNMIEYNDAIRLMDEGEYEKAIQAFLALGEFENSDFYIQECENNIIYENALSLIEAGDYEGALMLLSRLPGYFKNTQALTAESEKGISYNDAVNAFDSGEFYLAYSLFTALGDFKDSAARALLCAQDFPETGVVSRSDDYPGTAVTLRLTAPDNDERPTLLQMYTEDDELVLSVFIRADESTVIRFPAGTYILKMAFGHYWFGFDDLFGGIGSYQTLTFDDNEELYNFIGGYEYALKLRSSAEGNVGAGGGW